MCVSYGTCLDLAQNILPNRTDITRPLFHPPGLNISIKQENHIEIECKKLPPVGGKYILQL